MYLLKVKKESTIYNEDINLLYIKELPQDSLKCVKCFGNFQYNYHQVFNDLINDVLKRDHLVKEDALIEEMRIINEKPMIEWFNKPIEGIQNIFKLLLYTSFRFDPLVINNPEMFETDGIIDPPVIIFEEVFKNIDMKKQDNGTIKLISKDGSDKEEEINNLLSDRFKDSYHHVFYK